MSRLSAVLLATSIVSLSIPAHAGQFASSASDYVAGNFSNPKYLTYNNPSAALGRPTDIVGEGSGWQQILSAFSPHFQDTELVSVGTGGSITFSFASPIAVTGGPIIGIYTDAGLNDANYPMGQADADATTMQYAYSGIPGERSAIVEVAGSAGIYYELGRVIFDMPTNAFASGANVSAATPAPGDIASDFTKPFALPRTSLANLTYEQMHAVFDGSAGGNWITVPTELGLSEVTSIRISQPMWSLDGNVFAETYDLGGGNLARALVSIDTVAAVPEPASAMVLLSLAGLALTRRRA